jgi:hypothetical protein
MHTNIRLTFDQTLENATGVGAPPWTWPRDELVIVPRHPGDARMPRARQSGASW